MELILEVVSSERHMLGDQASHRFLPAGGVIGRSSECDWSIPDQTRHLSGRHAIISYEAGQFFITDISTNGIYLNGPESLPRNVAMVLHDEDRLVMGEYQMRVQINLDSGRAVPKPARPGVPVAPIGRAANPMDAVEAFVSGQQPVVPAEKAQDWHRQSVSMPDNLRPEQEVFTPPQARRQPAQDEPAGFELPEDWLDLSVVPMAEQNATPRQPVKAEPGFPDRPVIPRPGGKRQAPNPGPQPHQDAASEPRPPPAKATFAGNETVEQAALYQPRPSSPGPAVRAFAEGLGLSPMELESAGVEEFMQRAGALLRQCLQGMVANAQTRASLKNEFRLDMTLVNPQGNNPVKLSANGEQVIRHLLSAEQGSFQSVEDGVQECVEDFRQHQLAMMAGMQRAFLELIQQLSPDELERRFERTLKRGISFGGKGARYWEAYRELHQELQEEDDIFASMFVEPFARAYDEQIQKLKHSSKNKKG